MWTSSYAFGSSLQGRNLGKDPTEKFLSRSYFWTTLKKNINLFVRVCLHFLSTTGGAKISPPFGPAVHETKPNYLLQFWLYFNWTNQDGSKVNPHYKRWPIPPKVVSKFLYHVGRKSRIHYYRMVSGFWCFEPPHLWWSNALQKQNCSSGIESAHFPPLFHSSVFSMEYRISTASRKITNTQLSCISPGVKNDWRRLAGSQSSRSNYP